MRWKIIQKIKSINQQIRTFDSSLNIVAALILRLEQIFQSLVLDSFGGHRVVKENVEHLSQKNEKQANFRFSSNEGAGDGNGGEGGGGNEVREERLRLKVIT